MATDTGKVRTMTDRDRIEKLIDALKDCANRLEMAASDARFRGSPSDYYGYARIAERSREVIAEVSGPSAATRPVPCDAETARVIDDESGVG